MHVCLFAITSISSISLSPSHLEGWGESAHDDDNKSNEPFGSGFAGLGKMYRNLYLINNTCYLFELFHILHLCCPSSQ